MMFYSPEEYINQIINIDALSGLKKMPTGVVNTCVTSPPYWGLRDYGTGKWVGGDPACTHRRDTKNANPDWAIQTRAKIDNGTGDANYKDKCMKCGAMRQDMQLGLEKTPEEYVARMVEIFTEVRRALRDDGTLWLNLGDSYISGKSRYSTKAQTIEGGGKLMENMVTCMPVVKLICTNIRI